VTAVEPQRLLLVGMMGAGKTTVGRALAELTGWPYVDNDELVASIAGLETEDVQQRIGGDELHLIEAVVVERILAMPPPLVAGVPGSAVVADDLRARVRQSGYVVWLRARLDTLVERVGDGGGRPFFAGHDVRDVLAQLYDGRARLYDDAADRVVDVDDLTPREVAQRILDGMPAGVESRDH
jgi:shikimate kinase